MKNKVKLLLYCLLVGLFSTHSLYGQNVGIGTTTPSQKLEVVGNIIASGGGNITATGTLSATQIDFSGFETGNINTSGNINALGILTAGTIDFSGTEMGGINTDGNITTSGVILGDNIVAVNVLSAGTIDFIGNETGDLSTTGNITGNDIAATGILSGSTINFSGAEIGNISTTGNIFGQDIAASGWLSGSTIDFSGTETGSISTTGNISTTNTMLADVFTGHTLNAVDIFVSNSCSCPSDARFKQRIQQFPQALEKVLALRGVEYDFDCAAYPERGFSQKHQIGFIAQELQAVLPELVTTMDDGYLAVDYQKLTPVLVEAIKAQQQTILELQTKLQRMENLNASVSQLEARLLQLEKASSNASQVLVEK
jgi:Chaperone of endosialidase